MLRLLICTEIHISYTYCIEDKIEINAFQGPMKPINSDVYLLFFWIFSATVGVSSKAVILSKAGKDF